MLANYDIIIRPVITERSLELTGENKYTFFVHPKANKVQIKEAVEEIFGVKVQKVRTMHTHGKLRRQGRTMGYTKNRKKAIVTLQQGHKIELFEGS